MVSLRPDHQAPPLLAVSDTLRLWVIEERCHSDVCSSVHALAPVVRPWRADPSWVATVDSSGASART